MSYQRVIPRDLFNESKLLKCLGQLALLIHNGVGIRWPLELHHRNPDKGFIIKQDDSCGDLFCDNLILTLGDKKIELHSVYNNKSPYPLMFDNREGDVFNDDGTLSKEFTDWLDAH